jgi:hypothetical protein
VLDGVDVDDQSYVLLVLLVSSITLLVASLFVVSPVSG